MAAPSSGSSFGVPLGGRIVSQLPSDPSAPHRPASSAACPPSSQAPSAPMRLPMSASFSPRTHDQAADGAASRHRAPAGCRARAADAGRCRSSRRRRRPSPAAPPAAQRARHRRDQALLPDRRGDHLLHRLHPVTGSAGSSERTISFAVGNDRGRIIRGDADDDGLRRRGRPARSSGRTRRAIGGSSPIRTDVADDPDHLPPLRCGRYPGRSACRSHPRPARTSRPSCG